jgi:type I restriction enzyme M protein
VVYDQVEGADPAKGYRNRQGETLFIDARNLGTMINRTTKELTADDIATIADTYHAWRSTPEELADALSAATASWRSTKTRPGSARLRLLQRSRLTTMC